MMIYGNPTGGSQDDGPPPIDPPIEPPIDNQGPGGN